MSIEVLIVLEDFDEITHAIFFLLNKLNKKYKLFDNGSLVVSTALIPDKDG